MLCKRLHMALEPCVWGMQEADPPLFNAVLLYPHLKNVRCGHRRASRIATICVVGQVRFRLAVIQRDRREPHASDPDAERASQLPAIAARHAVSIWMAALASERKAGRSAWPPGALVLAACDRLPEPIRLSRKRRFRMGRRPLDLVLGRAVPLRSQHREQS